MNTYDKAYYDFIKSQEPQISSHIMAICGKLNISLAGFEYRLKSEGSLTEKLYQRKSEVVPIDSLKDICRYTMIIPKEQYTQTVKRVMQIMEATGQQAIKFRNNWNTDGKYQGINAAFQTGDVKYELQFHTQESYQTKHDCHDIYELERVCKDIKQRAIYSEQQKSYFLKVSIPDGAIQLSLPPTKYNHHIDNNQKIAIFDSDTVHIEAAPLLDYLDSQYGHNEQDFRTIASMRDLKTLVLTKKQIQLVLENKVRPSELYLMQKCSTKKNIKSLNKIYQQQYAKQNQSIR